MIEGFPRISVLVITYKQEHLIGRALDSLLVQKDYLYEICVSDDCSPDNTWQVLLDYQNKYPGLIKLHQNDSNVGIFENIEQSWTMPTGNVIYQLSGDDECGEGWFKSVVEYIQEHNIDCQNELFCIYGDYLVKYPNGDSIVCRNSIIKKYPNDALRLAIRDLICNRGCCFSIKVLQEFEKVSQGRSHIAELLQDRMLQLHSKMNYYIPLLGNVYSASIGISAHLNDSIREERKNIRTYAEKFIESRGIKIKKVDKYYGDFVKATIEFRLHKSLFNLCRVIKYRILSLDPKYCLIGERFRTFMFAILRRIPHRRSIHFR